MKDRLVVSGVRLEKNEITAFISTLEKAAENRGTISSRPFFQEQAFTYKKLSTFPVFTQEKKLWVLFGLENWTAGALSLADFGDRAAPLTTLLANAQEALEVLFGPISMSSFFDGLIQVASTNMVVTVFPRDFLLYRFDQAWSSFWTYLQSERDLRVYPNGWRDLWDDVVTHIPIDRTTLAEWFWEHHPQQSTRATTPPLKRRRLDFSTPTIVPLGHNIQLSDEAPPSINPIPKAAKKDNTQRTTVCFRTVAHDLGLSAADSPVDPCEHGRECRFIHNWRRMERPKLIDQLQSAKIKLAQRFPQLRRDVLAALETSV